MRWGGLDLRSTYSLGPHTTWLQWVVRDQSEIRSMGKEYKLAGPAC